MSTSILKPLHILMTADTIGGVWTYSLQLIKSLMPYNVKVTLFTMGEKASEDQRKEAGEIKNLSLIEGEYRLEWMENCWEDVDNAGKWLLKLERDLKPDLIHLNGYVHASLKFSAPKVVVGHSCIYSWWNSVKKENPPSQYAEYFTRVKRGLAAADHVVAPTYYMLSALNKYYGSFKKQTVISNAHDPSFFHNTEKSKIIYSMGRLWDEAKNLALLESVADKLNWPTFIAGEKQDPGNGRDMAMKESKACFLGMLKREDVVKQLASASIFVMPARYEPFGLSILEAALSGCALVLGDIPSLRENWNGAALFVSPDKPDELKEILQCLTTHSSQREKLAEQAYLRAQEFMPEKMALSYYTIYSNLISAAKSSKSKRHLAENNLVEYQEKVSN